jgi:putative endonuclease
MKNMSYTVYILRCSDDTLYIGITTDMTKRLRAHNGDVAGGARYTHARRPVHVVYTEPWRSRGDALRRERELKNLSRKDKITLIESGA